MALEDGDWLLKDGGGLPDGRDEVVEIGAGGGFVVSLCRGVYCSTNLDFIPPPLDWFIPLS